MEKKKYGGYLNILLPIWIIGQVISLMKNAGFAGLLIDNPLIPIILIGSNIVAIIGLVLLLQFKKIGFYIFTLTYLLNILLCFIYPDYFDSSVIFKSTFGLGLFLLLMCFKNKETKLNGYQTLGIIMPRLNIKAEITKESEETSHNQFNDIATNQIDSCDNTILKDSPDEKELSISTPENDESCEKKKNETKNKISEVDVSDRTNYIINKESTLRNNTSLLPRFKGLSKGVKLCVCTLVIFLSFLFLSIIYVNLKTYPEFISSFGDKWKYTFNLSNNQLGRKLLGNVYSLRKNTFYLIDVPGYNKEVQDSAKFFKNINDLFREYPSINVCIADCQLNDFNKIIDRDYYIIEPKTGEPYACNGEQLSASNDAIVDAISSNIYQTKKYDYSKNLKEELELLEEAASIPISDINLIREIGKYYEETGNLSKAIDYYRFVLNHNNEDSGIRGMLAYVLALNGESEKAREEAKKAIEDNPKEQEALSALALLEADNSNWKEAKLFAKKAIDYGVDDSNVYYAYCEALYKLGEVKHAQDYYNKAYELYRLNPRRERYKKYAGCPFEVLGFHYCSERNEGKIVIPYDEKLVKSSCFFIGFKIDVNILRSEESKIGIKIYSNGKLETGQPSKDGYTYYENVDRKETGENYYYISGWGNEVGNAWSTGNHEIEIWYKGKKIAEDSFYIY